MWHRTDSVPWIFTNALDSSDEVYAITYRDVGKSKKSLSELVRERFGNLSVIIAQDMSLRLFYVFTEKERK